MVPPAGCRMAGPPVPGLTLPAGKSFVTNVDRRMRIDLTCMLFAAIARLGAWCWCGLLQAWLLLILQ